MDFTIDAEQTSLLKATKGLITSVYDSSETRREVIKTDPGFSAWEQLAEMGLLSLPFEATPVEVSLVAEELGRVIAPDPYVEAVAFAGSLVAAVASDEQRESLTDSIADGSVLPIVAWAEEGSRWDPKTTAVTFSDGKLNGVKTPVIQGERADLLIVSAATDNGTGLFLVRDGYEVETARGFDGSRVAKVTFSNTPAERLGAEGDQIGALAAALDRARIAYGHEALGSMQTCLDTTVDYLKTRKQFGVTLNTFQALNFRAADLYVALELARSVITWATIVAADESSTEAEIADAASQASLQVSTAGRLIGQDSIQLHGGIAMTAEYSVGHHMARLAAIEHIIGDGDFHRARLAAAVGDHGVLDPIG